jgi:hypothetical protein
MHGEATATQTDGFVGVAVRRRFLIEEGGDYSPVLTGMKPRKRQDSPVEGVRHSLYVTKQVATGSLTSRRRSMTFSINDSYPRRNTDYRSPSDARSPNDTQSSLSDEPEYHKDMYNNSSAVAPANTHTRNAREDEMHISKTPSVRSAALPPRGRAKYARDNQMEGNNTPRGGPLVRKNMENIIGDARFQDSPRMLSPAMHARDWSYMPSKGFESEDFSDMEAKLANHSALLGHSVHTSYRLNSNSPFERSQCSTRTAADSAEQRW